MSEEQEQYIVEQRSMQDEVEELTEEELNQVIEELCLSKAEEFKLIGYEHVDGREIWDCVNESYQKTGTPQLHQIVNDIMSLRVTKFMNWLTINAYKGGPF